ncbi:unnamed protein product [Heligmosomoides polygyrus]|uniref:Uncharacterized protein n=1 Tax=Heligmosomoides polygyrus TaxID=6339 RepID=A0A3P8DIE2_HELPZ|nr:unnamed protein product [Heligmosomoides polygyrus]
MALLAWLKSIPNRKYIQWTDFDPIAVINEIHHMMNIGSHHTFFERAGVGHGYLDRPCMNPLDPECPKMSPNYYDVCPTLGRFRDYAARNNITLEADDFSHDVYEFDLLSIFGHRRRRKRDTDVVRVNDTQSEAVPLATSATGASDPVAEEIAREEADRREKTRKAAAEECKAYRGPMMRWMFDHPDKWSEFLSEAEYPRFPDYAQVMSGGCPGFAAGVLHWPEDMILGGVKRSAKGATMESADALQSVFLVASPNDVFLRFKHKANRPQSKPDLDQAVWSEELAKEVIQQWQRNFTRMLYRHPANFDEEVSRGRVVSKAFEEAFLNGFERTSHF